MFLLSTPRDGNFTSADYQIMVRSDRWKLVEIYGSDDAPDGREGMLFDLKNDPSEIKNLWDSPDHLQIRSELREALLEWRVETGRIAAGFFSVADNQKPSLQHISPTSRHLTFPFPLLIFSREFSIPTLFARRCCHCSADFAAPAQASSQGSCRVQFADVSGKISGAPHPPHPY